jgi:hypothetical protein
VGLERFNYNTFNCLIAWRKLELQIKAKAVENAVGDNMIKELQDCSFN